MSLAAGVIFLGVILRGDMKLLGSELKPGAPVLFQVFGFRNLFQSEFFFIESDRLGFKFRGDGDQYMVNSFEHNLRD